MTEPRDPTPEAFASEPLRTASQNAHPVTGRPLDGDERIERREDREALRVERYPTIDGNMVQFVVLDQQNRVRGALALELSTSLADDPQWLLERVRRGRRPILKIV